LSPFPFRTMQAEGMHALQPKHGLKISKPSATHDRDKYV